MEPFKVTILGCGSAMPTLKHNPSSQIVEVRGKLFMVDCGEGTQVQLRRQRIGFTKIMGLFISHLHGDHCLGLVGMVSTFGMLGRTAPFHIYSTPELEPVLKMQLDLFCKGLEFDIVFHGIDTTSNSVIYEDRSLTVETVPLQHRVPCCGFIFREKPSLPHIRRDMMDFYNIPLCERNNIKNGADWTTPDGIHVPNSRLTYPADLPRSYAYCSDTKYMPQLFRTIEGVSLLYHESTYLTAEQSRAQLYYHSTAAQAALVAASGRVGRLMLGHYSARYDDESAFLDEAKPIFNNTILSHEGLIVDV